jgi:hypothetical protein
MADAPKQPEGLTLSEEQELAELRQRRAAAQNAGGLGDHKPEELSLGDKVRIAMAASGGNPGIFAGNLMQLGGITPGKMADLGLEAGGSAMGQSLGALGGPAAPLTVPVGGAIGGASGNLAAQARQIKAGERDSVSWGEVAKQAAVGAIPGAPLAGATGKTLLKEGAKYAVGSMAGNAFKAGAERRTPTVEEVANPVEIAASFAAPYVGKRLDKLPALTPQQILQSERDAAFRALRPEGVKLPPHEIDRGSDMLSSVAGKAASQQQAARENALPFTRLTREEVGLKGAAPITEKELAKQYKAAYEPYEKIASIQENAKLRLAREEEAQAARKAKSVTSSDPHERAAQEEAFAGDEERNKAMLDALVLQSGANIKRLREVRAEAKDAYRAFQNGSPAAYDKWKELRATADTLEQQFEEAAKMVGDDTLVDRLRDSRKQIAKLHVIEDSLNKSTRLPDINEFGKMYDNGVPLDGNLEKLAKFAIAFRRESVDAANVPAPGVDAMRAHLGAMSAARGNPAGAGWVFLGSPTRKVMLSEPMQNYFAQQKEPVTPTLGAAIARFATQGAPDQFSQRP